MRQKEVDMSDIAHYPDIWWYDRTRRIYKDNNGHRTIVPYWFKSWIKLNIIDETSQSWISSSNLKIPKNAKNRSHDFAFSLEEIQEIYWIRINSYKIAEKVRGITNIKDLKRIAEIVGYTE